MRRGTLLIIQQAASVLQGDKQEETHLKHETPPPRPISTISYCLTAGDKLLLQAVSMDFRKWWNYRQGGRCTTSQLMLTNGKQLCPAVNRLKCSCSLTLNPLLWPDQFLTSWPGINNRATFLHLTANRLITAVSTVREKVDPCLPSKNAHTYKLLQPEKSLKLIP